MSTAQDLPTTSDDLREGAEPVDPELLELPDPPKRERTITVVTLLVTAVASVAMIAALRHDAAYAFAERRTRDLGDLSTAPASALGENLYVEGHGMLGAARAIRYERPLIADSFRLMPIAGRGGSAAPIWVEVPVPAGAENVRWVPPDRFVGRLVRFDAAGPRHRGLAAAVREATGQEVTGGSYLLVAGEAPERARWAILLSAMFAVFALWNVFATAKLLRKVV